MSRDAIVSRWVIHDRLLSPSMATNTLVTGAPTLRKGIAEQIRFFCNPFADRSLS
ncbi:MAG: hypothetical protein K0A94_02975 [Desulfuromonadales bacterium]|nr:hypothetical protein [Desulfuromonadales bacterium]